MGSDLVFIGMRPLFGTIEDMVGGESVKRDLYAALPPAPFLQLIRDGKFVERSGPAPWKVPDPTERGIICPQ